jgi:hypothetical protein
MNIVFKTSFIFPRRRSRFNDPDEVVQPIDDARGSPSSQDGSKDDRPVFERLKSLAEGKKRFYNQF